MLTALHSYLNTELLDTAYLKWPFMVRFSCFVMWSEGRNILWVEGSLQAL